MFQVKRVLIDIVMDSNDEIVILAAIGLHVAMNVREALMRTGDPIDVAITTDRLCHRLPDQGQLSIVYHVHDLKALLDNDCLAVGRRKHRSASSSPIEKRDLSDSDDFEGPDRKSVV